MRAITLTFLLHEQSRTNDGWRSEVGHALAVTGVMAPGEAIIAEDAKGFLVVSGNAGVPERIERYIRESRHSLELPSLGIFDVWPPPKPGTLGYLANQAGRDAWKKNN